MIVQQTYLGEDVIVVLEAAARRTHKQHTCTNSASAQRAPVAEWLAISILDSIYVRARRSRRPTRRGGLTAGARATCAHLSPPLHHQEPDGTPKQNGQQRTCRECSRHHRSPPRVPEGSPLPRRPARSIAIIRYTTHGTPDSRAETLPSLDTMIYAEPMTQWTRTRPLFS